MFLGSNHKLILFRIWTELELHSSTITHCDRKWYNCTNKWLNSHKLYNIPNRSAILPMLKWCYNTTLWPILIQLLPTKIKCIHPCLKTIYSWNGNGFKCVSRCHKKEFLVQDEWTLSLQWCFTAVLVLPILNQYSTNKQKMVTFIPQVIRKTLIFCLSLM